jgi:hypothetical protein
MHPNTLWRKYYALPAEHGAWIWLLGPFVLGAAAGGNLNPALIWLLAAGLAAFLSRQPATIAVKALSGRRSSKQLQPALIWFSGYLILSITMLIPLVLAGFSHLGLLVLPGMPVFSWHLWLVKKRQERRQPGVEIVAAGVLSLMAPAAYWVAGGTSDWLALVLWLVCWLQSAASIVHIHLRLQQRQWDAAGNMPHRLRAGWRSLAYHSFNLVVVLGLVNELPLPPSLLAAFSLVWLDGLHGVLLPAVGYRPSRIGIRQLIFSLAFFLVGAAGFLAK